MNTAANEFGDYMKDLKGKKHIVNIENNFCPKVIAFF